MKDYFKLDRQSAKINDVSEILTVNRVNVGVVYSTYQKIVDLTVKNSACVFRTDSQQKYEIGDEIFEVNDEPVKGMEIEEVINVIENQKKTGSISFLICHESLAKKYKVFDTKAIDKPSTQIESSWIRAQFDYKSVEDPFIPCVKLGLDFTTGDVLQIVSKDDNHYWQAKKALKHIISDCEFEEKVGLIPSKIFRVQCQSVKAALIDDDDESKVCINSCACNLLVSNESNDSSALFPNDIDINQLSYQELKINLPDPFNRRPIAIIGGSFDHTKLFGTKNIVENGIVEYLAANYPEIFEIPQYRILQFFCLTDTNSQKMVNQNEKYHYLDTKSFEHAIAFDELMTYEKNRNTYCGILSDSAKKISRSGKVCIFYGHEKCIESMVRNSLKPFIILIILKNPWSSISLNSNVSKISIASEQQIFKISKIIVEEAHWVT
ncbi:hypothetical protein MXB_3589, partial [Myxobolus squamalis]